MATTPVPPIPDTERYIKYTPSVSTTDFNIPFALFGDATDILVYVNGVKKALTTDYTVLSATTGSTLSPIPVTDAFVRLVLAVSSGTVEIYGNFRPRKLIQNTAPYSTRDFNVVFSTVISGMREIWSSISRAIQAPVGESGLVFPSAASRANNVLAFDSAGNLIPVAPAVGGIVGTANILDGAVTTPKIADTAITTAKLTDKSVTFAKIADMATNRLLGRSTAGNGSVELISVGGGLTLSGGTLSSAAQFIPVRQTVLSGPVDSSGFAAFGGSTGGTTVTASGTLIVTAANGMNGDRVGTILNPSWTGLTNNGTSYLTLIVNADGTCTPTVRSLGAIYLYGGTRPVTSGQFQFNVQEMYASVGNGSTAVQGYELFIGEVTIAGNVVTAITWYALMGRYDSGWTATLPATGATVTRTHNLGITPEKVDFVIEATTANAGYAVGDRANFIGTSYAASVRAPLNIATTRNSLIAPFGSNAGIFIADRSTNGELSAAGSSQFRYKFLASRGW